MPTLSKISPCLWFNDQADEAANFYVSIFKGAKILSVSRYGEAGREFHQKPPGSIMTVAFELLGQTFTALNGGPQFRFSEAISFEVACDTQDEIDQYWDKLSAGGDPSAQSCGWLKDKFGVSWQIVPSILPDLLNDRDTRKSGRVMNALMHMKKLDIAFLKRAHDG